MQRLSERKLLTVLAAVQFVNVLEFMIVLPLGPDFARALDVPLAHSAGWEQPTRCPLRSRAS